ncbi:thiolase domain-containing protein [Pusillimonas sp. ANT_WB101]|uniref:thiolase domain-containing protein n=1 Tax=Pusillimonas sp. ANT_WB101 TaxID=2597356 RepID=UPI0011EDB539|nr:thiolase domain-containing protein [Pusillimonas sp. ANT_WB101]KAA0889417.1 thiolase domain-containing protein [Pusillimonas sp. ANT_WB101]
MSLKGKAYIVGAYEHPTRFSPDKSVTQLHAECALGALQDAGLTIDDVDGYFCAGDVPGGSPISMVEYLNLNLKWVDGSELGGCSYMVLLRHAAMAIAQGKCSVALITLAGKPKSMGVATGTAPRALGPERPETPWDLPYKPTITGIYGMLTQRHMYEYGTTSAQLAAIKVAASHHAQYNEHAALRKVVTVDDVLNSPVISTPLHRLDCCVITDGGGALVVTSPEIARKLNRPHVRIMGTGETINTSRGGYFDSTQTGAAVTGKMAFEEAGVGVADIKYASIYDNFTIMVLMQLEDLGFCKKGEGGHFVAEGNLISGQGQLPFNTDGGGLCNNHPSNRGGMTKVIEAVRQLRGEAHPSVQVKDCDIAMASGPGLVVGVGHAHSTIILERE